MLAPRKKLTFGSMKMTLRSQNVVTSGYAAGDAQVREKGPFPGSERGWETLV